MVRAILAVGILLMVKGGGSEGKLPTLQEVVEPPPASCDDIADVWQELCRAGRCEPRADGGCRKRSASGVCTTFAGCVQGHNLENWQPVFSPPVVPEAVDFIREASSASSQRYVNLLAPENGQEFLPVEALRVRLHVEIFVKPQVLAALAERGGDRYLIPAGTNIDLPGEARVTSGSWCFRQQLCLHVTCAAHI